MVFEVAPEGLPAMRPVKGQCVWRVDAIVKVAPCSPAVLQATPQWMNEQPWWTAQAVLRSAW